MWWNCGSLGWKIFATRQASRQVRQMRHLVGKTDHNWKMRMKERESKVAIYIFIWSNMQFIMITFMMWSKTCFYQCKLVKQSSSRLRRANLVRKQRGSRCDETAAALVGKSLLRGSFTESAPRDIYDFNNLNDFKGLKMDLNYLQRLIWFKHLWRLKMTKNDLIWIKIT